MSRSSKKFRTALLGASAMVSVALMASPAAAQDARAYDFDMPPQPLTVALKTFGATADEQLIFSERLVQDRTAPALKGAYTPDQALAMLLAGSGLVAERTPSGVVTIQGAQDPQSGSAAGDGAGTVETLIVTAQKREEDIQDVPIAISAFSQETLERSQVAGGPDLMTQVPNMTFTKTNFSSYSIQIRGIGTQAISATTDAAVAVAFNNTPFIRNRFFEQEFYDLQRVEVLRGPQGTLYGRNATAGVVNIISAKPKFAYEAKLSGDVSNYNSMRLEGMVNLPLVEDKVALRLAGAWTKRDGYVTNEITGNPIDGRDLWSTRVSLRVSPTDAIDANLIWEHFNEDDDRLRSGKQLCHTDDRTSIAGHTVFETQGYGAPFSQGCLPASLYSPDSFEVPNGNSLPYYTPLGFLGVLSKYGVNPYTSVVQSPDLRVIESTVDPEYTAINDTVELQMQFDIGHDLTVSSETAYNFDRIFSTQDFNRFNTARGVFENSAINKLDSRIDAIEPGPLGATFCDPQVGCADRLVAVDLSTARSRQFSQEVRLASDFDGPFNFSLGANFLRYDGEDKYYVFINTLGMAAAYSNGRINDIPYVPGVSDSHECLPQGGLAPDTTQIQPVFGCIYMDPNPIRNLNDLGHNYFLSKNPYKLISYAVFGESYYNIAENLKLTAGLRWTVDKKEAPRIPSWLLAANTIGYPVLEVEEQEWREPTGRLAIDWKPDLAFTDETLLYASYARGYKAGGSNPPPAGIATTTENIGEAAIRDLVTKPKTFDPEFVDAYEIGAKNTLLDGRVTLNLSAFYYDYTGYQISQIIDRSAVNYNFDSEVWGVEIEADWRPLENLRLAFKGGYENTRIADGERAIDIMERNAGHGPDSDDPWIVVRPFPTQASNCVVPLYTLLRNGNGPLDFGPSVYSNGFPGPCEFAYLLNLDPVTAQPYVPNPTVIEQGQSIFPGYPGFDPTIDYGNNNGEGFFKELGGNELPNAPHFTATVTADYTIPLPNDWLATLHTDLYYQSEAWTRVFNMEGYDKLKAFTNVNVAAIFTNEDAGWKVMAYVKNVFDKDNITGAFLNSDDTGLTTNVFLVEPRLYGLRVTKDFAGGPWWTGADPDHPAGEPYPLTVEIGGALLRNDAPDSPIASAGSNGTVVDPATAQDRDLDLGEHGDVRLTYRPGNSPWQVSAAYRWGSAKGVDKLNESMVGDTGCQIGPPFITECVKYGFDPTVSRQDWLRGTVTNHEEHKLVDFNIGRDVGLGGDLASKVSAGLRYAEFTSRTHVDTLGTPDTELPEYWTLFKYTTKHLYDTDVTSERTFEGAGPTLSWELSKTLWGDDTEGRFNLDLAVAGGVLFGKQKLSVSGQEVATYYRYSSVTQYDTTNLPLEPMGTSVTVLPEARSKSVTVPTYGASLGLSYEVGRFKVGTGYRWERYQNVLDAGFADRKQFDRTMDGPYLRLSLGFGG